MKKKRAVDAAEAAKTNLRAPPSAARVADVANFQVGSRVVAKCFFDDDQHMDQVFLSTLYYPGEIIQINYINRRNHSNTYNIKFDDGYIRKNTPFNEIEEEDEENDDESESESESDEEMEDREEREEMKHARSVHSNMKLTLNGFPNSPTSMRNNSSNHHSEDYSTNHHTTTSSSQNGNETSSSSMYGVELYANLLYLASSPIQSTISSNTSSTSTSTTASSTSTASIYEEMQDRLLKNSANASNMSPQMHAYVSKHGRRNNTHNERQGDKRKRMTPITRRDGGPWLSSTSNGDNNEDGHYKKPRLGKKFVLPSNWQVVVKIGQGTKNKGKKLKRYISPKGRVVYSLAEVQRLVETNIIDRSPNLNMQHKNKKGVTSRCGTCDGCTATKCGSCKYCMDQKKRGGTNTLRKPCMQRICVNNISQQNVSTMKRSNTLYEKTNAVQQVSSSSSSSSSSCAPSFVPSFVPSSFPSSSLPSSSPSFLSTSFKHSKYQTTPSTTTSSSSNKPRVTFATNELNVSSNFSKNYPFQFSHNCSGDIVLAEEDETLKQIALKRNVNVQDLLKANANIKHITVHAKLWKGKYIQKQRERASRNRCSFNFYSSFLLSNLFHCHRPCISTILK